MLARNAMTKQIARCTPWDTVQTAATLMRNHSVGAVPVVADLQDPLLEGMVTDRDLCMAVVAHAACSTEVPVGDVMSRVPATGLPETSLEECLSLMRNARVGQIPIVDHRARCVGILTLADLARCAPPADIVCTLRAISEAPQGADTPPFDEAYFYCGQLHESDQIALLERRRQQATHHEQEVLQ